LKAASDLDVDPELIAYYLEDIIAVGDSAQSKFFGHNNAEKAVLDLALQRKEGLQCLRDLSDQWCSDFGQRFRRPVVIAEAGATQGRIVSPGVGPLKRLEEAAAKTVFISYKWDDIKKLGRQRFVLKFARELASAGIMVWMDRLTLPGYAPKGEHSETEEDKKLERLLKYGYKHSVAVLALGTKNYGQQTTTSRKNWTLREWTGEVAPGKKIKRVVLPLSKTLSSCLDGYDRLPFGSEPSSAAFDLKSWMEEQFKEEKQSDLVLA
jgi:hypothetical protein